MFVMKERPFGAGSSSKRHLEGWQADPPIMNYELGSFGANDSMKGDMAMNKLQVEMFWGGSEANKHSWEGLAHLVPTLGGAPFFLLGF